MGGDSGESAYGSSASPYGQGESGESQSGEAPYGQDPAAPGPYGQGQSGPDPYSQSQSQGQYGQSQWGYDPSGGQSGGGMPGGQGAQPPYGQQSDPSYGQGQYPPASGPQYGQQPGSTYDPNAQYSAPPQGYPPQQYNQPGYPQYAGQTPVSESDEKLWGLLAHLSIPFIGFIGPLIVYLVYKDRSPWLKDTSTEALNFSILYSIVSVVCSILITVLIGLILLPIVFIAALVFCILAALAANRHELYRYPVNWRLIK